MGIFDDVTPDLPDLLYNRFRIIKTADEARKYLQSDNQFILGVGSPAARLALFKKLTNIGGVMRGLISPKAFIGKFENKISEGVTILANAVIENENRINEGVLLHIGCLVSHECSIGRFCEISPGAKLLGKVTIGDLCSIGAGAVILPKVKIGNNVVVGAGAVVTKDIAEGSVVAGVPAKRIR